MNQIKVIVNGILGNLEQVVANHVLADERFALMHKQKAFWKNREFFVNRRCHSSEYGQIDWRWLLEKILH